MNPLNWSWAGVLVAVVAYWLLVVAAWIALVRRRARSAGPATIEQRSPTNVLLTFEEEISLMPLASVLLAPPLVLVVVWLLAGRWA
jgi:hypothetical protein